MKLSSSILFLAGGLALAAAHTGHHHHHDEHVHDELKAAMATLRRDLGDISEFPDVPPNAPRCALGDVAAAEVAASNEAVKQHTARGGRIVKGGTINTYFHVIQKDDGRMPVLNTVLPNEAILANLNVLNADFRRAKTGYKFNLAGIDRVNSTALAVAMYFGGPFSAADQTMKNALHQGGRADLNVYVLLSSFGSWSSLPWWYEQDTLPEYGFTFTPKLDGVVLDFLTMPGVYPSQVSLGKTLTHEVGHWMGLWHTFDGGCDKNNDFVLDTPREAVPAVGGCQLGRDTCPQKGTDPVTNYMDYSDDYCYDSFSRGQVKRMWSMYSTYRLGK